MALEFPDNERNKRYEIEALMRDWAKAVAPQSFTPDGFYPYYWNQPIRVLAVGRESRGLTGIDYIDCVLNDGYWISKIGDMHINKHILHRRLMYVVYGILKGHPSFGAVPTAAEIGITVGKKDGISFAWMNLSKISNESEDYRTNYDALGQSYNAATCGDRNFIAEEVVQLAPDVIVSMNVGKQLCLALSDVTEIVPIKARSQWLKGVYELVFRTKTEKKSILIDAYHFAAHNTKYIKGIDDKNSFYDPICSVAIDFVKATQHS